MGAVRNTITLTEQQDCWIKAQINAGHDTNNGEYIRDLIRREQERSDEIEAIRKALIEGEASGEPRRFDSAAFKQRMQTDRAEYRLTPAAECDLEAIWGYTAQQWGTEQANRYIDSLLIATLNSVRPLGVRSRGLLASLLV